MLVYESSSRWPAHTNLVKNPCGCIFGIIAILGSSFGPQPTLARHALCPSHWARPVVSDHRPLVRPTDPLAEADGLPSLKGHVPALDAIRGPAIVLVTLYRFGGGDHGLGRAVHADWLVEPALRGVDLFFVLSGFLITGILFDAKRAVDSASSNTQPVSEHSANRNSCFAICNRMCKLLQIEDA